MIRRKAHRGVAELLEYAVTSITTFVEKTGQASGAGESKFRLQ